MSKVNATRTEFASALQQIAHERGLDPNVIIDTIKQAIVAAFKKDHADTVETTHVYDVELDPITGEARVFAQEAESYDEDGELHYKAKPKSKRLDVTPPGFGRIAAQAAKQVIYQKIREAEKSHVVADYEKRLGQIINGMVVRFAGNEVIVDIGKAEAVMPKEEQVSSESYHTNQRLTFFIHSIRDSYRGREIILSRADTGLIRELFRREVPEVGSGVVEIKAIARDPGSRSKVAVYSRQSTVDPVGSCVGQKGVRVQAVITELLGEKLDIIQYSDSLEKFVVSALAPAEGLEVKINPKTLTAQVTAPTDQLSLAIGREGQNAKLAGRLTGLHIDIQSLPAEKGTSEAKETTPATNQDADSNTQTTPTDQ